MCGSGNREWTGKDNTGQKEQVARKGMKQQQLRQRKSLILCYLNLELYFNRMETKTYKLLSFNEGSPAIRTDSSSALPRNSVQISVQSPHEHVFRHPFHRALSRAL